MLPLLEAVADILKDVLPTLWPLAKKLTTWLVLAILLLLVLWQSAEVRLHADELGLAAKPRVEKQLKTVTVSGPVQIETKTVYVPGTTQIQYVDRIVERAPVTTTTEEQKTIAPAKEVAAPAPKEKWRYAGVMLDPTVASKLVGVRGGVTFWNTVDLGLGARFAPHPEAQAEAGIRF